MRPVVADVVPIGVSGEVCSPFSQNQVASHLGQVFLWLALSTFSFMHCNSLSRIVPQYLDFASITSGQNGNKFAWRTYLESFSTKEEKDHKGKQPSVHTEGVFKISFSSFV